MGDYLAAITNRYAGMFSISPGAVRMENMLLEWMAKVIGYPEGISRGSLTSGGSMANLTAIVTARDAFEISRIGAKRTVCYFTEAVHHSINRALHIAGLDECKTRKIDVDDNYRMNVAALEEAILDDRKKGLKPWLVVASAGTVNTGTVDPLAEIGRIASDYGLWFHVDGAYGGMFNLCPEGKKVLEGIELSHSVSLDPHKSLFLPYGSGAVLIRDGEQLYQAFRTDKIPYLEYGIEPNPYDLSIELTRHFRGLRLWLPLKLLGVAPFRAALSEKIFLARYFYEQVQLIPGFKMGPSPDLSIVSFRYHHHKTRDNEVTKRLFDRVREKGRVFITNTKVEGTKLLLRAAILNHRTHLKEINETIEILTEEAEKLTLELG